MFFLYWTIISDCWHITSKEINGFKIPVDNVDYSVFDEIVNKFIKNYKLKNLALDDLSGELNSDFSEDRYAERNAAIKKTNSAIDRLSEKYNIIASMPNLYAIDNTNIITDAPTASSGNNIISIEVPFVQMVLSGYKDVASEPANISDGNFDISHLIAYGTLPNFTFSYAKSSEIMNTNYAELYSLCFEDWKEDAVKAYKAVSEHAATLRGKSIVKHEILESGLVRVTYENGASYTVNDTALDITDGDITLAAGEYIFKEGN